MGDFFRDREDYEKRDKELEQELGCVHIILTFFGIVFVLFLLHLLFGGN